MTVFTVTRARVLLRAFTGLVVLGHAVVLADTPPIVQPGAPGESSRELSAEEAIDIAVVGYSPADVRFMQDMIPHHHQAIQMAALVADRTNNPELIEVAGRIDASQDDEIEFMRRWLAERGEHVPEPTAHEAMHTSHEMAGMASPEEMAALAAAEGTEFDRLFLTLMIAHHAGAVTMVEELLEQPGSAFDPVLFEFTTDVTNDQTAEIERMNGLLVGLSDDPRAGLEPGYANAGQAIMNMELVESLAKPPGFLDPRNPAGLPPKKPKGDEDETAAEGDKEEASERWPFLMFASTDMAFAGDVLVAGSYHGFNVYRLGDDGVPGLLSSVVCPGGQGDVSIVGDLLIMSVEQTRGRLDCGLEGVTEDVSPDRFRGLRIFDIGDLERPVQVGAVQTCRGSHTHSVVSGPGDDGKIIVYNSGTSSVREEEELPGCIGEIAGDERTALFRIDVIEIPVDDPSRSRIVDSPAVFADPEAGVIAGLWRGGDHGDDTQETSVTDQCHDITVFPEKNVAAGACSGNGILFDVSDPLNPQRLDAVVDEGFAYWHSATFNNDGTKVLFTDEWGGGTRPRCRAHDPLDWGADAIYDIVDGKLEYRGHFKLPAPQVDTENCVAHNGSIVPVPGRDIFVQAWYQGGISVIDFTDSANPVEIAWFDRGPIDEEQLILGGFWSTYWYRGRIYGTEIVRGLDVLALTPSEYLSENELAAAAIADQGERFNPQQQFAVTWPAAPVVARAYLDQLRRDEVLPEALAADVRAALDEVEKGDRHPARRLRSLASSVAEGSGNAIVQRRRAGLAESLNALASEPRWQDFVALHEFIPGIELDVRYHSDDNFVGARVDGYRRPVALMSRPAAVALRGVRDTLGERGLTLKIFDAYRPQKAVDHFVRWSRDPAATSTKGKYYPALPKTRLFELGYIAEKSGHTRGSTVDLTIVDAETGKELDMGSPWDFFGEISHHDSPMVDATATANRNLLRDVMVRHGFEPYANEWWHYTLADEPFPATYFDFDVE